MSQVGDILKGLVIPASTVKCSKFKLYKGSVQVFVLERSRGACLQTKDAFEIGMIILIPKVTRT